MSKDVRTKNQSELRIAMIGAISEFRTSRQLSGSRLKKDFKNGIFPALA